MRLSGFWQAARVRLVTFREPAGAVRVGKLDGEDVRTLAAPTMLHWLAGEGREAAGAKHRLADVQLLAPLPEPPSVRDFYAYEGHVAAGWRRRGGEIPAAWYDAPVFYFSNPASIRGPGEPIERPAASSELDFELEIAAVIGGEGEIAGFTLMNDWSARDVQRAEMTVGLGPHKGKDFAISLGPWLVTPDELPLRNGRLQLEATVTVNGKQRARANAGEQHFGWDELLAHAARDTRLRPGDVLGSGTLNGGCLLELGGGWIEPGDVVALEADGLGMLETPVS
ncbi:MAG: fumarylacetoacetate hydrolase family protein [Thermoleophilaceae bacterium]